MDRLDLTLEMDRLAIVDLVFQYPQHPHKRIHGPEGYRDYESYRDWLRDEFSFRCVFSLIRESWISAKGNFDIDHLQPRASHPDLTCEYDNLVYLAHSLNLIRGKRESVNPCEIALGKCLFIHLANPQLGEIEALNKTGEQIIRVFRLDSSDLTALRSKTIRILRALAICDESTFREMVGFPSELPDLRGSKRRPVANRRPKGIGSSSLVRREKARLPDWY